MKSNGKISSFRLKKIGTRNSENQEFLIFYNFMQMNEIKKSNCAGGRSYNWIGLKAREMLERLCAMGFGNVW